jgi:hypothetical protein
MPDDEPMYDDVLLAYQRIYPPHTPSGTIFKPTVRQRIRIKRHHLNRRVQQWIHDHLPEAMCDL